MFYDVGRMSIQAIKRMNRSDDDGTTEYHSRYTHKPKPRVKSPGETYPADIVWAAAFAAQRNNGTYVPVNYALSQPVGHDSRCLPNRNILMFYLADQSKITDTDREAAAEGREWLRNNITLETLMTGHLSLFDQSVSKCVEMTEFDTILNIREISILASLPSSIARRKQAEAAKAKILEASNAPLAGVGERLTVDIEVVKSVYSVKFGTNYITGITSNNCAVFFSYRTKVQPNTKLTVKGTVKAHRSDATQLTRVRVLETL